MEASDIPDDLLFIPVPLQSRLQKGVDYVKDLAMEQRDYQTRQAAERSIDAVEVRFDKVSAHGTVDMTFSSQLDVPDNLIDIVNEQKDASVTRNKLRYINVAVERQIDPEDEDL